MFLIDHNSAIFMIFYSTRVIFWLVILSIFSFSIGFALILDLFPLLFTDVCFFVEGIIDIFNYVLWK